MESTDCSSPEYSIGIVFARRVKDEKYALIGITNCRSLAQFGMKNGRGAASTASDVVKNVDCYSH
jgi:hypothetical protein